MSDISKDEDSVLDYTQNQRERIVNHMTQNGQHVPSDTKEISVLLATLDGMDRAALTKKKIKSESETNSLVGQANAAITEILLKMRTSIRPVETTPNGTTRQITIPENLTVPEIVPGELDTQDPQLNYHSIMSSDD